MDLPRLSTDSSIGLVGLHDDWTSSVGKAVVCLFFMEKAFLKLLLFIWN